ncbi:putative mitochondrial inner membrane protein COX18 [Apostichopus japonicus]|uniref:Putative mitochondrial inner membrane protein COX18 n=1 Tax=Stichopus japonicus TaxID=307972 RepID=A0A2G8KJT8_STIJA|nr:putative mitochondrial inner membrane protein COX18 [Apostichopus japonicus]
MAGTTGLNFGPSFDTRSQKITKAMHLHHLSHRTFLQAKSAVGICSKRFKSTEPVTVYEHILTSEPVHMAQSLFELGQSLTGFHWAGSIAVTTFALRFVLTFPLSVYAQNIRGKVEGFQPEIVARSRYIFSQRFRHRMKEEKWSEKRAQRVFLGLVRLQAKEIYVRENCHPAKGSVLLLVQLPLWITMSLALRNMSGAFSGRFFTDPEYLVSEFATDGALWFHNLMIPDPYLVLPVLVGVLNLINIEMHALHKGRVSGFQKGLNNFLRVFSVLMVPIAAYIPSSLVLYWTVSAAYSLGQNIVLKLPSVRTALNITKSKTDSATPFQDMKEVFECRYLGRKREGQDEEEELKEMLENVPEKKPQKL